MTVRTAAPAEQHARRTEVPLLLARAVAEPDSPACEPCIAGYYASPKISDTQLDGLRMSAVRSWSLRGDAQAALARSARTTRQRTRTATPVPGAVDCMTCEIGYQSTLERDECVPINTPVWRRV